MFSLDRTSPVPLHTQVEGQLRTAITDGALPTGAVLPPEPRLALDLGVARGTVRQAIQRLVHEGLLDRRRGHGTYVVEQHAPDVHTDGVADSVQCWNCGSPITGQGHSLPGANGDLETLRDVVVAALGRHEERETDLRRERDEIRGELRALREELDKRLSLAGSTRSNLDEQLAVLRPRAPRKRVRRGRLDGR